MKKKFKSAVIKKTAQLEAGVKVKRDSDFYKMAQLEAGELYEGVTDNATVSSSCDYRMITRSDDTVSSQGS